VEEDEHAPKVVSPFVSEKKKEGTIGVVPDLMGIWNGKKVLKPAIRKRT